MDSTHIIKIIAETIEVNPDQICPYHSIGEIGNWDSVHNLLIFAKLESVSGIVLPIEELYQLTSIQSIIDAYTSYKKV